MHVEAIERQVRRHRRQRVLRRAAVAERDDVARAVAVREELDERDPPVARAGRRDERRRAVRRSHFRERVRGERRHALAFRRKPIVARGSKRDRAIAAFLRGQRVVADEGRAALEQDRVAGPRAVERVLQVAAC